jgi:uncharacterized protein
MLPPADLLLPLCLFFGAMLYSSVGHGGASAYLAMMALFGLAPAVMRPTALVLNVLVSGLASLRFIRAGQFDWRAFWPVLLGAAPMAYIGGGITLPGTFYRPLVGGVLLFAAFRLFFPKVFPARSLRAMPIWAGVLSGVLIGFLAGLTGTGGGIFLSPLLLFMGWAETRKASGIAALFILVISLSGLAGNFAAVRALPTELPLYAGAAVCGALIGTWLGVSRLAVGAVQKALGAVLIVAGLKMILS